jgi:hypothetical protein
MGEDRLDLHVLFEAGGNQPEERLLVLDALDELVQAGMLDARMATLRADREGQRGSRSVLKISNSLVIVGESL